MNALDVTAFVAYIVGVTAFSVYLYRRRPAADPFLANRAMSGFPIGLSVMITLFSAVNFVAFPTEVMGHGLYVLASLPVFVLVAVPVTRIFIPFFHRMQLTSLYAYLEQRFDRRTRLLAGGLFIVWRLFWMATALYASTRILSMVTGISPHVLMLAGAGVATFYTALGGIRTVMWTDVIQFSIMLIGIGAALTLAVGLDGWTGMWAHARAEGLLRPVQPFDPAFFSWRPTVRITLWSALIGTFVAFLTRYGADQMVVQRYFTARDLKAAVRGFWWNIVAALTALLLLTLLGLAIAVSIGENDATPMQQFGAFVRSLPFGLTGVLAAGLLAATMSSMDSGMNACLAVWMTDFEGRKNPVPINWRSTRHYRVLLWILAGITVALAYLVGRTDDLFALVNRVVNGIGSPLLALVLLGLFSRTCNARGAWLGGAIGMACSLGISFGWDGLSLHYYAVVNLLVTLAAALAVSKLTSTRRPITSAQQAWTWFERGGRCATHESIFK